MSSFQLREQRLQHLIDSCQQEVLRQIIGPFGLTPAMFADQDGGNVTTQKNAEAGIFAKDSEQFDRSDYDYVAAKREKMREAIKNATMNSQEFVDAYGNRTESTKRTGSNGKVKMNAELDHLYSVKDIHREGGWMKDEIGRTTLSSNKDNLHFTTMETNRSKSDKAPEEFFTEENGFDPAHIDPLLEKARESLEKDMPSDFERVKYHSKELAREGAKEAGKNALRQVLGLLLHEFVSGSFVEVKRHLQDHHDQQSFIDKLVESLRRVMQRIAAKAQAALEAAVQGGAQGLVSNLLTFLINNFITTSAKIVSLIRESMRSLWQAIKLMANPPDGMSALEKARAVSKIIAGVLTTGLGMLMEESVKSFVMSIPILAPIADLLSAALTAIMTGIGSALIIYGIDRLFDWLDSTGTELVSAQEAAADAQLTVITRLQALLSLQFENSRLYVVCAAEYQRIEHSLTNTAFQMEAASVNAAVALDARDATIDTIELQLERRKRLAAALRSI